jgi:hypothetical protein
VAAIREPQRHDPAVAQVGWRAVRRGQQHRPRIADRALQPGARGRIQRGHRRGQRAFEAWRRQHELLLRGAGGAPAEVRDIVEEIGDGQRAITRAGVGHVHHHGLGREVEPAAQVRREASIA